MYMITDDTQLILPNGSVLVYQGSGLWVRGKYSIWQDLANLFRKEKRFYYAVKVGERLITPDIRVWFCESVKNIREVQRVYV